MKITEIRELIRLARRFDLQKTTHIDLNTLEKEHPKAAQLIRVIETSGFNSDEELLRVIYGENGDANNYRFLKSHTSNLLLELFFHPKVLESIQAPITRGIFNAQKQFTLTTLFQSLGNRNVSNAIANKSIRLSEQYQLTSILIPLLENARLQALLNGNTTQYKKYNTALFKQLKIQKDEMVISSIDYELRLYHITRLINSAELLSIADSSMERAKEIASRNKHNFRIRASAYRIFYMCYQLKGDLPASLESCKEAVAYVKNNNIFGTPTRIGEFAGYEFETCLLLRDYKNGMEAAQLSEQSLIYGSNGWFSFKSDFVLFALQTEQFALADECLNEMFAHPRLSVQLQHLRERWGIFRLYCDYVKWVSKQEENGKTGPAPGLLRYKRYKEIVKRFPNYHKDKSGFNVAILLLNIMLLLESERYDEIIEQMESLNTYRTRYLRHTGTNQMAILFKLLRIVASKDFDYDRVIRSAKKYETQLFKVHQSAQEMNEGLQVLSPVWIWNRILTILQHRSGRY